MKIFATQVCAAFAACALALPAMAESCVGDLNGDREVTGADLGILLGQWGQAGSGDLDGNGFVGGADLGLMLGAWGYCPVTVPSWATLVEAQPNPAVVMNPVLRSAITATGLAWRVRHTATQIEMLLVPPGTFQMGCIMGSNQYGCYGSEQPVHEVTLTNAFYIGRFEVTQAQWVAKMGSNPSYFDNRPDSPSRPVDSVGPDSYLSLTGLRLPTEAEWEYACRAGTQTPFYNNSTSDSTVGTLAWYSSNSGYGTHAVGGKAANGFGLHDMLGNVWEWVSDRYGPYTGSPQTNPTGLPNGTPMLRGGCFLDPTSRVRASFRESTPPNGGYIWGFRVARSP